MQAVAAAGQRAATPNGASSSTRWIVPSGSGAEPRASVSSRSPLIVSNASAHGVVLSLRGVRPYTEGLEVRLKRGRKINNRRLNLTNVIDTTFSVPAHPRFWHLPLGHQPAVRHPIPGWGDFRKTCNAKLAV